MVNGERKRTIYKEVWLSPTLFKLWKKPLETTEKNEAVPGWVVQLMPAEYFGGGGRTAVI